MCLTPFVLSMDWHQFKAGASQENHEGRWAGQRKVWHKSPEGVCGKCKTILYRWILKFGRYQVSDKDREQNQAGTKSKDKNSFIVPDLQVMRI